MRFFFLVVGCQMICENRVLSSLGLNLNNAVVFTCLYYRNRKLIFFLFLDMLGNVLWNLYNYYKQFSESVHAKLIEQRHPIEKELKVRMRYLSMMTVV